MRLHVVALPQIPTGPGDADWRIPYLLMIDEAAELAQDAEHFRELLDLDVRRFTNCEGLLVFEYHVDPVPPWASAELASIDALPETLDGMAEPPGGDE